MVATAATAKRFPATAAVAAGVALLLMVQRQRQSLVATAAVVTFAPQRLAALVRLVRPAVRVVAAVAVLGGIPIVNKPMQEE
jgi:hypothetical protein